MNNTQLELAREVRKRWNLLSGKEMLLLEAFEKHLSCPSGSISEPHMILQDSEGIMVSLPASDWFRRNFFGIIHS